MEDGTIRMGAPAETDIKKMDAMPAPTVFDDLVAELATPVEVEIIDIQVAARPNLKMMFRPDIDMDTLKRWQKSAKVGNRRDAEIDPKKLAVLVLVNTCVGLKFEHPKGSGEYVEMTGKDGKPLTFTSKDFQEMVKAGPAGAYGAIDKLYGKDGHMTLTAQIVLAAAGYTDYDLEGDVDGTPLGG